MAEPLAVPLAVDLDGTLIRTDLMWESLAQLLRRNPFALFPVLWWWSRGRARLKQELAARVCLDPAALPYHQPFLAWLRKEKLSGRPLVLATASDRAMAQPVFDHLALFDDLLASDGQTNLRDNAKLRALQDRFGERGFDYAGNSSADFAVWRGSRAGIVVNANPQVRAEAARCTRVDQDFSAGYNAFAIPQRILLELFWRSGYLLAGLAGLLLAAAFPSLNLEGFAWIAPAVLLLAARNQSGPDSVRTGCVAGLVFWLASLTWLLRIPVAGFPILGWLALSGYLCGFTGAWVWFVNRTRSRNGSPESWASRTIWALGGAAAWVALELLRGWLFTGFPWSFLGVSQFRLIPLIQLASITGVYGLSFLMVWFSLSLYSAAQQIGRFPGNRFVWQPEIALPMVAVLATYLTGFFSLDLESARPGNSARVTLVQPSVPITLIWNSSPETDAHRFAELLRQSRAGLDTNTDLLVWPESGVPELDAATYRQVVEFTRTHHVSLILNADDLTSDRFSTNFYNSALLLDAQGNLRQVYHKRKLVAFGEYIPLVRWLPFIQWFTPISGGWTPGDSPVQFDLTRSHLPTNELDHVITVGGNDLPSPPPPRTNFRVAPLICFEDVFPSLGRSSTDPDTDFLVNLTNDGWFGGGAEQWQHCAAAVFRAVENGRPLLRCANNGITCLIDPHGRITRLLTGPDGDVHSAGTLTVDVPLSDNHAETWYHTHGDYFAWSCTALAALRLVPALLPRRKTTVNG